jgi:translocation and assembly module TamB
MTRPPNNRPGSVFARRLRLFLLSRTSLTLGAILLVALGAGAWWVWDFLNRRLVPLVESNLEELLGRPVEIGEVERFSFDSLRFTSASIPATATNRDRVTARAAEVRFDLWQLIQTQTLNLNVTLIEPDVYLQQTQDGRWIDTKIQTQEGSGGGGGGGTNLIDIELETIALEDGDLTLVASAKPGRPKGAIAIANVNGIARLLEGDRVSYQVSGQPTRGGQLELSGETSFAQEQSDLAIKGKNLLASDISRFVVLPIDLQGGRVDGDMLLKLRPNLEIPIILGTTNLSNVTGQIENLPQTFANTNGILRFQPGQNIALENIATRYGRIPVEVGGVINTQRGYNLRSRVVR